MSDPFVFSDELVRASPEQRARWRVQNRAKAASKVAAAVARGRHEVITEHLRPMAKAGLRLSEMARRLEAAGVLTPRGNVWWSARQVQAALRFALSGLRGLSPAAKAGYLGSEKPARRRKPNKVRIKGTNIWKDAEIKHELPGGTGYAKQGKRIRSKITKH